MKDLSSILQRITRALGKDTHIKSAVLNCIKQSVGLELVEDNIELRDGVLIISSSPAKNSSIHLKEGLIMKEVEVRCGTRITRIIYR